MKVTDGDEQQQWKNRIVRSADVDPATLAAHPGNWRVHDLTQREDMEEVFGELGWVRPVIVSERTGLILDGHMRVALAQQAGEPVVPVDYVDVTADEETKVLATFDPIGGMAMYDRGRIRQALADVRSGGLRLSGIAAMFKATDADHGDAVETESLGFDDHQTHDAVQDRYDQTDQRQIHVLMTPAEYTEILRAFQGIAIREKLDTNLDVLLWLVDHFETEFGA
jgi:hypothetical protein